MDDRSRRQAGAFHRLRSARFERSRNASMTGRQLDLFSWGGVLPPSPARRSGTPGRAVPSDLGDAALVAAMTDAKSRRRAGVGGGSGAPPARGRDPRSRRCLSSVRRVRHRSRYSRAGGRPRSAGRDRWPGGGSGGRADHHQGRRAGARRQGRGRGRGAARTRICRRRSCWPCCDIPIDLFAPLPANVRGLCPRPFPSLSIYWTTWTAT